MKYFYILLAVFVSLVYTSFSSGEVTINLSSGYANDVWYDFNGGVVKTEQYNNWDISIKTTSKNCSIGINSQKGMILWLVPNVDDSSWKDKIDTTGMQSSWKTYYNSDSTWNIGAFNLNHDGFADNSGDYGWGAYDMSSHFVMGNKIFIVKLDESTYKKIMIESLASGVFTIKWANLDGSDETSQAVKASDYSSKLFVYLSLADNKIIDREPASDTWALLFGKYTGFVNDGTELVPYGVTGVRTNPLYSSAKVISKNQFDEQTPALNDNNYVSQISNIGYDWKTFDMNSYQYKLSDSLVYFVTKSLNTDAVTDIHKIVFTAFEGSSTGILKFQQDLITSVEETGNRQEFNVYPNIIENGNDLSLNFNEMKGQIINVSIVDQNGKIINNNVALNNNKISINNLATGMYFIVASSYYNTCSAKFIVK